MEFDLSFCVDGEIGDFGGVKRVRSLVLLLEALNLGWVVLGKRCV